MLPDILYCSYNSILKNCGKIAGPGPKIFVYIRVANLGDFLPKKQILGLFRKTLRAFLDQYLDF
jgi:hypothetical protein